MSENDVNYIMECVN